MILSSRVQRPLLWRHSTFNILTILRLVSQPVYNGVVAWYVVKVLHLVQGTILTDRILVSHVLQSPYTVYVLDVDVCVPSCCNLTILTLCGHISLQQTRYYWKYTGSETSQSWTPDISAGTEVVFQVLDSNGVKATSDPVAVRVSKACL